MKVIKDLETKTFKTAGLEIEHWAHLELCTNKLSQLMNAKEHLLWSYLSIQWKCGGCNLETYANLTFIVVIKYIVEFLGNLFWTTSVEFSVKACLCEEGKIHRFKSERRYLSSEKCNGYWNWRVGSKNTSERMPTLRHELEESSINCWNSIKYLREMNKKRISLIWFLCVTWSEYLQFMLYSYNYISYPCSVSLFRR